MLVSEEARVFQVRGLRCSKEPTVLGLSPVRLGNRTYRAWMTTKLTPMVQCSTEPTGFGVKIRANNRELNGSGVFHPLSAFVSIGLTRWVTACVTLQIEPVVDGNLLGVAGFLDNLQRKLSVQPH